MTALLPILAIDTGQSACQCALLRPDGSTVSDSADLGRGHAEHLVGQIEALLAKASLSFADLAAIAVATGPGSFTGLRVGIAAANGFGQALDVPVIGVPSLTGISLAGPKDRPFHVIMRAGRGGGYAQDFTAPGTPDSEPGAGDLATLFGELPEDAFIVGDAGDEVHTVGLSGLQVPFVPIEALARHAATLEAADHPPVPVYVRPPDARPQTGKALPRARGEAGR